MYGGVIEPNFLASCAIRDIGMRLTASKPRHSSELPYCGIDHELSIHIMNCQFKATITILTLMEAQKGGGGVMQNTIST